MSAEDASAPEAGDAPRPAPAADPSPAPPAADGEDPADASGNAHAAGAAEQAQATEAAAEQVDVEALAAKAAKAEEYLDLAQRTRAEFENYRKRAIKETAAAQERGAVKLALELLPAIDNLDRALAHAPDAGDEAEQSFVSGVKHVHRDLIAALARAEIESYSPEGEPFDPQYHEAIAQQPSEGAEPGIVVEVYQRGYRRGESVLRPARVVVAG